MDEILIEEKKYVSSKQAAKLTGYAKDYIGQLCREGRVPARLVGRSWYVLESAIQDHRFGNQASEAEEMHKSTSSVLGPSVDVSESVPTEEVTFPRYESAQPEILPSLNRLNKIADTPATDENTADTIGDVSVILEESWKEWFDATNESEPAVAHTITEDAAEEVAPPPFQKQEEAFLTGKEDRGEDEDEDVPLHIVVPRSATEDSVIPQQVRDSGRTPAKRGGWGTRVIQGIGIVVAVAGVVLAALGSGYFDDSISSVSQASLFSGISSYNR